MAQFRSFGLAGSLLALLAVPATADEVTLGKVTLDIPAGWEKEESWLVCC